MSQEIKIAKIITRTGLKSSLPQPLSPGEFGTALDAQEIYIGLSPTLPAANNGLPIIKCYTNVINSQVHANQLISTYLIQISLYDVNATLAQVESAPDLNLLAGFTRKLYKIANKVYISYEYKYSSSVLELPVLPQTGLGTEQFFSSASGLEFSANTLNMSTVGLYTWEDAAAVSSLINFSFTSPLGRKPGLVNVSQNLRILTEHDLVQIKQVPAMQTLPANQTINVSVPTSKLDQNSHYVADLLITSVGSSNSISQFKVFVKKGALDADVAFVERYYANSGSVINTSSATIIVSVSVTAEGDNLSIQLQSSDSVDNIISVSARIL